MLYNFCGAYDLSREEQAELEQAFNQFVEMLASRIESDENKTA